MRFWDVTLNGKNIDSVPYVDSMKAEEVRRSLINHDNYDPGITVRLAPKDREKLRPYLGLNSENGVRECFTSRELPTGETFPQYKAVVGPFHTQRGAVYMRNNPGVLTVTEAEKLAREEMIQERSAAKG